MRPLSEQTPREIDEQLADLDGRQLELILEERRLHSTMERGGTWLLAGRLERLDKVRVMIEVLRNSMKPLNDEFIRRGGWHRYFLVAGGHIHRETSCASCHPTTRFSWLVELADCDEGKMVEKHGDGACAVCFPEVQNHPAFLAAAAARRALEASEAERVCPGSGKGAANVRGYARCSECGRIANITRRYKIRKHLRPPPALADS